MSKADKIKAIVKGVAPKETFGTNPSDPWSTKANISEFAGTPPGMLAKYLKSRGINPKFASKDQKIAHSKTGQFQKWQRDHTDRASLTGTNIKVESVDKKDTVTFDIPLLIRVLELAREDIKSDMDLHRVVERLINMRDKGMLTMDDYDTIAQIKENHIAIAMGKMLDDEGSMVLDQLEQLERAIAMIRSYVGKDYEKQLPAWVQAKVTLGTDYIDTVGNYLITKNEDVKEETEQIDEISYTKLHAYATAGHKKYDEIRYKKDAESMTKKSKLEKGIKRANQKMHPPVQPKPEPKVDMSSPSAYYKSKGSGRYVGDSVELGGDLIEAKETNYGGDYQSTVLRVKELAKKKPVDMKSLAARMQAAYAKDKKDVKEDTYHDSQAATQMPFDTGNNPADITPPEYKGKRLIQMSKSARIIKSIYKRQGVKEETYDWEKADKSVTPYGKPPKIQKAVKQAFGDDKDQAAMVLSGGKTLTGNERDTVEIDPAMKMRPNKPEPPKKSGT
jgi:hypothetical protein